ncbi:hypothetical protein QCA50_005198 [Cerrena zonata]|uniref:Ankyrin n=1 Tax=Cerrena zonata TaxID=2478898 RepID=A0AAW0GRD2_9APHY
MSHPNPSDEDKDELLLSCRYGELGNIEQFVQKLGSDNASSIRDDNNNTILHMVCANGHIEALDYLLTVIPPSLLPVQNNAGSTALHWAALNSHLMIVQKLVQHPQGPGKDLIDIKNTAGRTPLGEAEVIGWDEGAKWLVETMNLDEGTKGGEDQPVEPGQEIEVEIQDAEGQVAKMKIGPQGVSEPVLKS